MVLPLVVLAVPAALAGFANIDKGFEHLLAGALPSQMRADFESGTFRPGIAVASTAMAAAGIFLAWAVYSAKAIAAEQLQRALRPLHTLLENKYYADVLYEKVIVEYAFYGLVCGALSWLDSVVVDGLVNGVGATARRTAGVLRLVQTGQFQAYGALGFAGLVFTVIVVLALNPP